MGSPRITIQKVINHGKANGYIVLSKIYVNSRIKLNILWKKCGHQEQKHWFSLQQGMGCRFCSSNRIPSVLELNEIEARFGFKFLSTYEGSRIKARVKWECGHVEKKRPNDIKHKKGGKGLCGGCAHKTAGAGRRTPTERLRSLEPRFGFRFLDLKNYQNGHTKMPIRWDLCRHTELKRTENLIIGNGCGVCRTKSFGSISSIQKMGQRRGFICLDASYSCRNKVTIRWSSCGHIDQQWLEKLRTRNHGCWCDRKRFRERHIIMGLKLHQKLEKQYAR